MGWEPWCSGFDICGGGKLYVEGGSRTLRFSVKRADGEEFEFAVPSTGMDLDGGFLSVLRMAIAYANGEEV